MLYGPADEFFVTFSAASYVHIEDVCLSVVNLVLVEHRVLGRVHATNLRAVGNPLCLVPRPDALEKNDCLGDFSVGRPPYLASCRAGRRSQTLELKPVYHVLYLSVSVLSEPLVRHELKT